MSIEEVRRELVNAGLAVASTGRGCPAYAYGEGSSMFRTLTVKLDAPLDTQTCWFEDNGPIYYKSLTPSYRGKAKIFGEARLRNVPLPSPPSAVSIVVDKCTGRYYESGPGYLRLRARWERYEEVRVTSGLDGRYSAEVEFEAYHRPYPEYRYSTGDYRIMALSRSPVDEVKTSYIYLHVWTRGY